MGNKLEYYYLYWAYDHHHILSTVRCVGLILPLELRAMLTIVWWLQKLDSDCE
jgi:hypothetical protein